MQSEHCKKEIPTLDTRARAIFCCIWFGTMPWQLYEHEKHYEHNYWSHVKLNWSMIWTWFTHIKINAEELAFEQKVNPNWQCVYEHMFAGVR